MGPLNEWLKISKKDEQSDMSEGSQLFTEELANWFVDHFGGNFADMRLFIEEVMEKKEKITPDRFLSKSIKSYEHEFMTACKDPKAKAILDDLVKLGSFESPIRYDVDALDKLIEQNIIALHAENYSWNKRIVCVAYEIFVEERRKAEEERRKTEEENRKAEEERRKKPWYRFF